MPYKDPVKQRSYFAEYHQRNRQKRLSDRLWVFHGMRSADWAALWDAQEGRCYLCGDAMSAEQRLGPGSALVIVDHDHSCCPDWHSCRICRRGLAHSNCNVAIGMANDDPAQLRRMADALEAAQLAVEQRRTKAAEQLALEIPA